MQDHYLQSMLGEHEVILKVSRQHWFVLVQSALLEIFLAIIIIAAVALLGISLQLTLAWFGLVLLIIPVIGLAVDVINWSARKYVVTDRRVMQIAGVFNKKITDSSLEKVNDVQMVQSFWGRLFGFGDIQILTASELGANMFRKIGDPVHFKTAMLNAKEQIENPDQSDNGKSLDIPGLISQLDELRQQGVLSDEEFQRKKSELLAKL
jgi:uncharacterized membrane protein YdbT with pleckstrin-like domain